MKGFTLKLPKLSKTNKGIVGIFAPYIFIFLVSLVFFYPVWLQNKIPLPVDALVGAHTPWIEVSWEGYPAGVPIKNQEITDAISQFYPWRSLVGEFWRSGWAPLWNQYMFSGTPLLATLHSAGLYPLNFLYLIFTDANAWTMLIFLQIFLAGAFSYKLLEYLKLSKTAALFGCVSFMFSGYMIAWLEFATGGQAGLWLPLLLFLELRLLRTNQNKYFISIPFVFLFIFTAGDFQVPLYISLTYVLAGVYMLFSEKLNIIKLLKIYIALVFGILLSLPQLLPTVELFSNSVRTNDPYIKEYLYGFLHWEKVSLFLWPDFFGNVVTRNYWGKFGFHEYMPYVGTIALIFVFYSLISKKDKLEKFFWVILLTSLVMAFPTPLAKLPYNLRVPGLGTSSASRILFLVGFCLSVLAGYGFSKWQKKPNIRLIKITFYFLTITAGVALGLFLTGRSLMNDQYGINLPMLTNLDVAMKNMIPSTLLLFALLGILYTAKMGIFRIYNFNRIATIAILFMAIIDMLRFSWKNTPFSEKRFLFPTTTTIDYLVDLESPFRIAGPGIPLNYFMQYKIGSAEGYDPIYPEINGNWFSLVNFGSAQNTAGRYGEIANFSSGLLNYANVTYVIDYKKNPSTKALINDGVYSRGLETEAFEGVFEEGRVKIFKNKNVYPKIWLSRNYVVAGSDADMVKLAVNNAKEQKIVITTQPDFGSSANNVDFEIADFIQQGNSIEFSYNADIGSLLFLSESFNTGWRAFVDGKEVDILRANYIFQAIYADSGYHNVRFIYDPLSFRIGLWVATITTITLILIGTKIYFKKERVSYE